MPAEPAPRSRNNATSGHLLHHAIVGSVLGFPLAIWLSGALIYHPWGAQADSATYQVAMWSVIPLWATAIALCFLARSRATCWAALLLANGAAYALLRTVQA